MHAAITTCVTPPYIHFISWGYSSAERFLVDCSLLPPQELQVQLQTALKEVDDLREARERQKEMVFAVAKQRDMYQTLLAQSTPLRGEKEGA